MHIAKIVGRTPGEERRPVLVNDEVRVDRVVRVARVRAEHLTLVSPCAGVHARRRRKPNPGVHRARHRNGVVRVVHSVVESDVWGPDVVVSRWVGEYEHM